MEKYTNLRQISLIVLCAATILLGCSQIKTIHDPATNTWYDCDLWRTDYPPTHPCYSHAAAYQEEQKKKSSGKSTSSGFSDRPGPDRDKWVKDKGNRGKSNDRGYGNHGNR